MNLLGVGPAEAGLVFVIALIVVGPQRFPEIMRAAGRWYRVARAYSNEVMKDVRAAVDDIETEIRSESDELQEVRKGLTEDLREARESAEEAGRDTREALRSGDPDAPATGSIRPSQRGKPSEETDETAATTADGEEPSGAAEEEAPAAEKAPPAAKTAGPPRTEGTSSKAAFDPFKQEKPRPGPVVVRHQSAGEGSPTENGEDNGSSEA